MAMKWGRKKRFHINYQMPANSTMISMCLYEFIWNMAKNRELDSCFSLQPFSFSLEVNHKRNRIKETLYTNANENFAKWLRLVISNYHKFTNLFLYFGNEWHITNRRRRTTKKSFRLSTNREVNKKITARNGNDRNQQLCGLSHVIVAYHECWLIGFQTHTRVCGMWWTVYEMFLSVRACVCVFDI